MINDEKLKNYITDIVRILKSYNDGSSTKRPLKDNYCRIYDKLFISRSSEIIRVEYTEKKFSISFTKYFITYFQTAIRYDMITDNDSLFAQSTVSDTRYITAQDCEVLRNFYTRATGHEFKI